MNWDVISVKPLKPLELSVLFKDGTECKVRFEPGHLSGVFEALKAPEFFRQARVEEGAVTWPGEHGPAKSILPRMQCTARSSAPANGYCGRADRGQHGIIQ